MNISQSFIKSFTDYRNGKECGLVIYEKYVNKNYPPPTAAMKKGIYFEYLATGALPLDGSIPKPEISYQGTSRQKMASEYESIHKSVELFKRIIKEYKIKIKSISKKLTASGMSGILDIEAIWKNKLVYIDLKYTSLFDDKWDESGWETESLAYKDKLMIQGVHYKILGREIEKIEDIPFYYFVFNAKDSDDAKIILQEVDEDRINSHYNLVSVIRDAFEKELKEGLKPHPSLNRCKSCYIAANCKFKVTVPKIETVYY